MKKFIFGAALMMAESSICGAAFADESVMKCLDLLYFKWEDGFFTGANVYEYVGSMQEWGPLCGEGWVLKISDTARAASCIKGGESHWNVNFELFLLKPDEASAPINCERVDAVE